MPRLRTLTVATADGPRDILILDKVDAEHTQGLNVDPDSLRDAGIPPVLTFGFAVDLPGSDDTEGQVDITTHADAAQGRRVTLDVEGPTNTTSHAAWVEKNYEARTHRDATP